PLFGKILKGRFSLIRTRIREEANNNNQWLLIKANDEFASSGKEDDTNAADKPKPVLTGIYATGLDYSKRTKKEYPVCRLDDFMRHSSKQKSKEEIEKLNAKILDRKTDLCIALDEEATTLGELEQFSSLKVVMEKNGVAMLDNSKFVETVV